MFLDIILLNKLPFAYESLYIVSTLTPPMSDTKHEHGTCVATLNLVIILEKVLLLQLMHSVSITV